ncbi:MAG: hypothetical protein JWR18_2534 [Segetibacter sp.]|jgi:hypothetical protein|nr:hypothetical protein [Segetibacter sp.]
MGSQYKVLTGETVLEIERSVNEAFTSGWVPQGGLTVLYNASSKGFSFFQAMVQVQMPVNA